jgi:hypothetical protein
MISRQRDAQVFYSRPSKPTNAPRPNTKKPRSRARLFQNLVREQILLDLAFFVFDVLTHNRIVLTNNHFLGHCTCVFLCDVKVACPRGRVQTDFNRGRLRHGMSPASNGICHLVNTCCCLLICSAPESTAFCPNRMVLGNWRAPSRLWQRALARIRGTSLFQLLCSLVAAGVECPPESRDAPYTPCDRMPFETAQQKPKCAEGL